MNMDRSWPIQRHQMVETAAWMHQRGYVSGLSGNLSARLGDGNILITPSGISKGQLSPDHLMVVNAEGSIVERAGQLEVTSELPMHLEVYQQRPDVAGVIHAHPIACVALSLVGISLDEPLIPEALVILGPIPTTEYATPSSAENRAAIAGLIGNHNAIILSHHGSLTVGRDLHEAYQRLETLEHVARTVALAYQLGTPRSLSEEAIKKLSNLKKQFKF